ncbi:MAG: glycerol-3-phosphate responsive antiterminator [Bacillota bacterium]
MSSMFYGKIHENPIIAAITDIAKVKDAVESPCEIVFLLTGSIFNIKDAVRALKEKGKMVFIHLDLLEGISKDQIAIEYIHKEINPDGIITTKSNLVKAARDMGLFTIQRFFLVDSISVESGIKTVQNSKPDAVEIMPGIMHRITAKICSELKIPVITGGFINGKEDVIACLNSGAMGISTSNEDIWYM